MGYACDEECCLVVRDPTLNQDWSASVDTCRAMYEVLDHECPECAEGVGHSYHLPDGMRWNADTSTLAERHARDIERWIFHHMKTS